MAGQGSQAGPGVPKNPGPSGMLRQGFWNYAMNRWAPKNPTGRLVFEMGILLGFFAIVGVIYLLAQG